jgi:hypothetical protein
MLAIMGDVRRAPGDRIARLICNIASRDTSTDRLTADAGQRLVIRRG